MMANNKSSVNVRFIDEIKGRGLFTTQDIAAGTVLFEEKPLICAQFLWNECYRYEACEYCMRSMENAEEMARRLSANPSLVLPHMECCRVEKQNYVHCPHCQVSYCSSECREQAWNEYHQVLCLSQSPADTSHPLVILQEVWKTMHYPPETTSIMLIAKMIASIKQAQSKEEMIATFNQFCHIPQNEEKELSHKLLGKQFEGQYEALQPLLLNSLYEESVAQWFTPVGLRSLFALIGMNGQGIGSSSLSVYVHNCDDLDLDAEERQNLDQFIDQLYVDMEKESGAFLNCEGSALYKLQSCCNHSCSPNAEISFLHNNSTLSLVALTDVAEGQEVLISYLDECSRERSRHSRQKELRVFDTSSGKTLIYNMPYSTQVRENYLFTCDCPKCRLQCDDLDATSSEEEEEMEDS